jgi:hypothetical protein
VLPNTIPGVGQQHEKGAIAGVLNYGTPFLEALVPMPCAIQSATRHSPKEAHYGPT